MLIDIWTYERKLAKRLLMWAVVSTLTGLILILFSNAFWQAFGIQAAAWGFIDGLIAIFGLRRVKQKSLPPSNEGDHLQEARNIRKVLWINTCLDVIYIASGAALIFFLGTNSDFWQGTGWGIILQGGFLLIFDAFHAWQTPLGAK